MTTGQPVDAGTRDGQGSPTVIGVEWLKLTDAAALIGIDRDELYKRMRHGEIPGAKLPDRGGWHISRADALAYKALTRRGSRGPRRGVTLNPSQVAALLSDIQHHGVQAEAAKARAVEHAAKHHAAIRALHDGGFSVRGIAELLEVAPNAIARILKADDGR